MSDPSSFFSAKSLDATMTSRSLMRRVSMLPAGLSFLARSWMRRSLTIRALSIESISAGVILNVCGGRGQRQMEFSKTASIYHSLCFGENGVLCIKQVEGVLNPGVQV